MAQQSDPENSPFKVYPCQSEEPTNVELKAPYKLNDRQQKVVTKMSLIESGGVEYEEIEMVEREMPGSTGSKPLGTARLLEDVLPMQLAQERPLFLSQ
jgi:hypothetical protein